MGIFWAILLVAGGVVLLWKGADFLVSGSVGLAERFGISSLVIGMTVVAMGTSAPEVAASIAAAMRNSGNIALGNVFGSNIANLALVGGVAALLSPIAVSRQVIRREIPIMLGSALVLLPMIFGGRLSRFEGVILLVLFLGFITLTVRYSKRTSAMAKNDLDNSRVDESSATMRKLGVDIFLVIIGLAGLTAGAKMCVEGAVVIGQAVGMSEAVIGLTIIAVGTSLPELVTSVVAALKGHSDISIGNLVGSNVFNTLLVTGICAGIRPFEIVGRLAGGTDYWIMIVVSVGFGGLAILGRGKLTRICGGVLLGIYIAYIMYLFVHTAGG
jgi:cation:H+ antiporter